MSHPGAVSPWRFARRRKVIATALFVGLGLAVVALANAHLVYVAFTSQPACVTHEKERGDLNGKGTFRAAQPSC